MKGENEKKKDTVAKCHKIIIRNWLGRLFLNVFPTLVLTISAGRELQKFIILLKKTTIPVMICFPNYLQTAISGVFSQSTAREKWGRGEGREGGGEGRREGGGEGRRQGGGKRG